MSEGLWTRKTVRNATISVVVIHLVYGIICLAVRITWAKDSLRFSAETFDPIEGVPSIIFRSHVSAGAIVDIGTILLVVLVLVAIVKKWVCVICFWVLYTLAKNISEVAIALKFCHGSKTEDDKTIICLIGSPKIIFFCVVRAIGMALVTATLEYPDGTGRLPSQDERTAAESTDVPPTYSFVVRQTRSSATESDVATLLNSEAAPPYNSSSV